MLIQKYLINQVISDIIENCHGMPQNTFVQLKSNFHIANIDTLELADKFAKVRPLFKMLNEHAILRLPH